MIQLPPSKPDAVLIRGDAGKLDEIPDASVDLTVTSPPYWSLRSYRDDGEHVDGQVGDEPTPDEFLDHLIDCTREWIRVSKPSASIFVNLGDKMAGSGGHNNAGISASTDTGGATRRNAPDTYSKATIGGARDKSLMGLPWRYALRVVDELGLILRAEIVWSKPNGMPESVRDRVRRSHEQFFHFTLEPSYFAAVDEIRDPYAASTLATYEAGGLAVATIDTEHPSKSGFTRSGREDEWRGNPLGKLAGSVWHVPTDGLRVPAFLDVDHFAAFPQEIVRRIVVGWSPSGFCLVCGDPLRPDLAVERDPGPPRASEKASDGSSGANPQGGTRGDVRREITGYSCSCATRPPGPTRPAVVLDPFVGTGTVPGVARVLGRFGIGNDLSADYLKLARWRIFESGHFEKTRERSLDDNERTLPL